MIHFRKVGELVRYGLNFSWGGNTFFWVTLKIPIWWKPYHLNEDIYEDCLLVSESIVNFVITFRIRKASILPKEFSLWEKFKYAWYFYHNVVDVPYRAKVVATREDLADYNYTKA